MNRNYGYKFAFDKIGSSNDPCDEQYRGRSAFSEPETKAIRDFFDSHPDVKITINMHAWGNLLITPYNYDPDKTNPELMGDIMNVAYEDLHYNGGLPEDNLYGSGIQSIFYTANGDANDWMLHEKRIFAITTELGTKDKKSEVFFPRKEVMSEIADENFAWMNYTIHKVSSQIDVNVTSFNKN